MILWPYINPYLKPAAGSFRDQQRWLSGSGYFSSQRLHSLQVAFLTVFTDSTVHELIIC